MRSAGLTYLWIVLDVVPTRAAAADVHVVWNRELFERIVRAQLG